MVCSWVVDIGYVEHGIFFLNDFNIGGEGEGTGGNIRHLNRVFIPEHGDTAAGALGRTLGVAAQAVSTQETGCCIITATNLDSCMQAI